jgi:hypothetical protein
VTREDSLKLFDFLVSRFPGLEIVLRKEPATAETDDTKHGYTAVTDDTDTAYTVEVRLDP